MEFLRPNYKIEMWDFFQQLRAPCLRHAAEKSKDGFRPALCHAAEHSHFAQRLLLGHVANAAGVEQHNIGVRLATHALVAAGDERMRDLLGIALVHLAAVGLDEKFWHGSRTIHRGGGSATPLGWGSKAAGKRVRFQATTHYFVEQGDADDVDVASVVIFFSGVRFAHRTEAKGRTASVVCRNRSTTSLRWGLTM
jgi:hypothetical protein